MKPATELKVMFWGVVFFPLLIFPFVMLGIANAQEAPAPAPKQITVRPGLTITDESAFAVYVTSTTVNDHGQFAGIEMYVITDDGPQRLTLCDDVVVPCNPITVRAEGVHQGDGGALVWE